MSAQYIWRSHLDGGHTAPLAVQLYPSAKRMGCEGPQGGGQGVARRFLLNMPYRVFPVMDRTMVKAIDAGAAGEA